MSEKKNDCAHYDAFFDCCMVLSDWSEAMPVLAPCAASPCEYYEKKCEFCKKGDEKCGTCEKILQGMDGCSAECNSEKCVAYSPVKYCFMCGRRLTAGKTITVPKYKYTGN